MREKILRTQDVCDRLNISQTTLWRWRKAGEFPEPSRVQGSSLRGWPESLVDLWISKHFPHEGG